MKIETTFSIGDTLYSLDFKFTRNKRCDQCGHLLVTSVKWTVVPWTIACLDTRKPGYGSKKRGMSIRYQNRSDSDEGGPWWHVFQSSIDNPCSGTWDQQPCLSDRRVAEVECARRNKEQYGV